MSFLKYAHDASVCGGNGRGPLSFARAGRDGLPFRGVPPYPLKEEEYATHTDVVHETYVETFYLNDPDQKKRYAMVLDKIANHLYRLIFREHFWATDEHGKPYIVWHVEYAESALEFVGHKGE